MASIETVWGIDIGQCALKALKLSNVGGQLRLDAFDVIEHPMMLTQPEADRDQLIRSALEQFLSRHDVSDSAVVISVPGQSGFSRFVKLPPVEEKQVPEIVRFEAEQQIPFGIDEVIWRWQSFRDPDSPDIEVGIFAMKRSDVWDVLGRFSDVGVTVEAVQMAPLALYNFMEFDGQAGGDGATLLVDVGADKTDLVISDGVRIWTRTLQLGGNNFTEALVKAFKLTFAKAEKLKRTAATSKYARQVFQAMRPVFAELVQEVQRSIGYYTSLHRDSRFKRVVGLGNGFRLPGLQKYLEQNLGIPVARVDEFNKLFPLAPAGAPAFTENILSFAVSYGLALQGLGLTEIQTNLLPSESSRRRLWASKRPWFAAAAAMILVAAAIGYARGRIDRNTSEPQGRPDLRKVRMDVRHYNDLRKEYRKVQGLDEAEEQKIKQYEQMLEHRDFVPMLTFLVSESILQVAGDQRMMNAADAEKLKKIPRSQRRMLVVDSLDPRYEQDLSEVDDEAVRTRYGGAAKGAPRTVRPSGGGREYVGEEEFEGGRSWGTSRGRPERSTDQQAKEKKQARRGFLVYLEGTTPQQGAAAVRFLSSVRSAVKELAGTFPSLEVTASAVVRVESVRPAGPSGDMVGRAGSARDESIIPDPLTKDDISNDTRFVLGWAIVIKDHAPPKDAKKRTSTWAGGM